tara:strand:- start:4378 stop:4635 length:258 start_codon:yes stop_codon:yes gene_type:complete
MNKSLLAGLICIILYLFIKQDGIIDYYQIQKSHKELVFQKNQLDKELQNIKTQNQLLKHNKRHIEKIAREEYFYIYPDEIIISFE